MVKKAIIPAAGYGTRGLPITKVLPKEMFPIGLKPAIHYVVEEAIESGIEQILMIVSKRKNMIVDYFDESLELEAFLERENKQHLIPIVPVPTIPIHYIRQPYAKGLGDAIRLGKSFIGDEPFAVLLPDDIMLSNKEPALKQLVDQFKKYKKTIIGIKEVEESKLKHYGVISGEEISKGLFKLNNIVEKPSNNAPSNFAVTGRYIFTPEILSILELINASEKGELQLTDAIRDMIFREVCYGKVVNSRRFDIGLNQDYVNLINEFNNPNFGNHD
ncbi:UTP--glucose-1-phosphate uridylyltransferase [Sutcliffiella horikoshii]|uniref:UTP--glucose-1-phosphate uridylyltransferase n=1 Tax=Sutcliffiella horikoshii TaxID=79883 RepID=A0AA95B7B8_9BACI|nr:UTP--glucose-1-phosphate uridylyltransferase [Sutcliffiella horikoshii]TYS61114.1 UTP--glucose-1-phosphate uridylyltransferase [Sutcliffiella horikoshii]